VTMGRVHTQVEVPTLCYHPMLTIVGQCRLCLVQLANRQGKLVAGCATHVEEGMDIITESETLTQNGTHPYVGIPVAHRVPASSAKPNRTHHSALQSAAVALPTPQCLHDLRSRRPVLPRPVFPSSGAGDVRGY
jgi:predicted molibdopterin-dependent oxidoreductase YjgC